MLNTLANHGFLPHDGKDITREVTENALFDALNINKTLGRGLGVVDDHKHQLREDTARYSRTSALSILFLVGT